MKAGTHTPCSIDGPRVWPRLRGDDRRARLRERNASNAALASGDLRRSAKCCASSSMRATISSGDPRMRRREAATAPGGNAAISAAALGPASTSPGATTLTRPRPSARRYSARGPSRGARRRRGGPSAAAREDLRRPCMSPRLTKGVENRASSPATGSADRAVQQHGGADADRDALHGGDERLLATGERAQRSTALPRPPPCAARRKPAGRFRRRMRGTPMMTTQRMLAPCRRFRALPPSRRTSGTSAHSSRAGSCGWCGIGSSSGAQDDLGRAHGWKSAAVIVAAPSMTAPARPPASTAIFSAKKRAVAMRELSPSRAAAIASCASSAPPGAEHPRQIGRRAERRFGRCVELRQQPAARAVERIERVREFCPVVPKAGSFAACMRPRCRAALSDKRRTPHRPTAAACG